MWPILHVYLIKNYINNYLILKKIPDNVEGLRFLHVSHLPYLSTLKKNMHNFDLVHTLSK